MIAWGSLNGCLFNTVISPGYFPFFPAGFTPIIIQTLHEKEVGLKHP